jgi:SAM-dependent methyltransferase
MPDSTREFYDNAAAETAAAYETVNFQPVLDRILETVSVVHGHASAGARRTQLLDIGCGSGRDAAFFHAQGFEVTGTDAGEAMLREARRYHPELQGRLLHHSLPTPLPFADDRFAVVTAMAVLMHLREKDLPGAFAEIARVTTRGGIVAYSVNTARSGLDADGNDAKGRHFTCLPAVRWEALHQGMGLRTRDSWESDDISGRPGIRWASFVCERS